MYHILHTYKLDEQKKRAIVSFRIHLSIIQSECVRGEEHGKYAPILEYIVDV